VIVQTRRRATDVLSGKRREARLRTRLRAQLISRFGAERGFLSDLSLTGCRIDLRDPPHSGDVIVRWGPFESQGEIVWYSPNRVGIRFLEELPYEWLIATRQMTDASPGSHELAEARAAAKAWAGGQRPI